ncbi:MAG: ATP-binding cassette domain-containing protein [Eubacterium sp.]|jgi:ABC-2 type transport system ATP-binding protein|nr:ATP-binding cassette domain-containing protein [Eubacterium sp.]
MENVIEIKNMSKSFKRNKVLNDINISIEKGSVCGFVGLNGSGKTLLMKVIAGFLKPDCGTVLVQGKEVGKEVDFPEDIGVIIETPSFMPYISGYKNLYDLYSIKGIPDKEKIRKTMQLVGLDPDDKKFVFKYSLGMRQRLGIAQAIMEEQSLLILDEPMNGLDKKGVEEMRTLFLRLKEAGRTIVIASHNQADIDYLCDKVYELDNGNIIDVRSF